MTPSIPPLPFLNPPPLPELIKAPPETSGTAKDMANAILNKAPRHHPTNKYPPPPGNHRLTPLNYPDPRPLQEKKGKDNCSPKRTGGTLLSPPPLIKKDEEALPPPKGNKILSFFNKDFFQSVALPGNFHERSFPRPLPIFFSSPF